MANYDLRKSIKDSTVYMYQIADALGISENTLYRMLRKELTSIRKEKILSIVNELQMTNVSEKEEGEFGEY